MLARIDGGAVQEFRNLTLEDVPPHKRDLWLPVVEEGSGPTEQVVVEADRVRRVRSWTADQIAAERVKTCQRIDDDAEQIRLKYISAGAGMALTYQEKFVQAEAVDAMGEAAAGALTPEQIRAAFPTLAASIGVEAASLWDVAQLVLSKYSQFAQLSYVIERTRLAGKKAVNEAEDLAAIHAAYGAVTWTV